MLPGFLGSNSPSLANSNGLQQDLENSEMMGSRQGVSPRMGQSMNQMSLMGGSSPGHQNASLMGMGGSLQPMAFMGGRSLGAGGGHRRGMPGSTGAHRGHGSTGSGPGGYLHHVHSISKGGSLMPSPPPASLCLIVSVAGDPLVFSETNMDWTKLNIFRTRLCDRLTQTHSCHMANRCLFSHDMVWPRRTPFLPRATSLTLRYIPVWCPRLRWPPLVGFCDSMGKISWNIADKSWDARRCHQRCTRGDNCPFVHNVEELLFHPEVYKTRSCCLANDDNFDEQMHSGCVALCPWYFCPFAHDLYELRDLRAARQAWHLPPQIVDDQFVARTQDFNDLELQIIDFVRRSPNGSFDLYASPDSPLAPIWWRRMPPVIRPVPGSSLENLVPSGDHRNLRFDDLLYVMVVASFLNLLLYPVENFYVPTLLSLQCAVIQSQIGLIGQLDCASLLEKRQQKLEELDLIEAAAASASRRSSMFGATGKETDTSCSQKAGSGSNLSNTARSSNLPTTDGMNTPAGGANEQYPGSPGNGFGFAAQKRSHSPRTGSFMSGDGGRRGGRTKSPEAAGPGTDVGATSLRNEQSGSRNGIGGGYAPGQHRLGGLDGRLNSGNVFDGPDGYGGTRDADQPNAIGGGGLGLGGLDGHSNNRFDDSNVFGNVGFPYSQQNLLFGGAAPQFGTSGGRTGQQTSPHLKSPIADPRLLIHGQKQGGSPAMKSNPGMLMMSSGNGFPQGRMNMRGAPTNDRLFPNIGGMPKDPQGNGIGLLGEGIDVNQSELAEFIEEGMNRNLLRQAQSMMAVGAADLLGAMGMHGNKAAFDESFLRSDLLMAGGDGGSASAPQRRGPPPAGFASMPGLTGDNGNNTFSNFPNSASNDRFYGDDCAAGLDVGDKNSPTPDYLGMLGGLPPTIGGDLSSGRLTGVSPPLDDVSPANSLKIPSLLNSIASLGMGAEGSENLAVLLDFITSPAGISAAADWHAAQKHQATGGAEVGTGAAAPDAATPQAAPKSSKGVAAEPDSTMIPVSASTSASPDVVSITQT